MASSPITTFEFDEIEADDRLRDVPYLFADINIATTPDLLGVDEVIDDQNDAFLAALQTINPELVKIYKAWHGSGFFWLRLPQPSEGTACPQS